MRPPEIPIDPNGNLSSRTEGTDTWGYEWNANNELTRVTKNGVEKARFAYDPLGRRVEKVAGGVTTGYTYDEDHILREVRGQAAEMFMQGPWIDEALAVESGTGLSFFHADGLWSIAKVTDGSGAEVLSREHDVWGNLQAGEGGTGYAFTGREWDAESGLYYYRARYYDPMSGRFISDDPSGFENDINLYQYVFSNPTRWVDPTGEGAVVPPPSRPPSPIPCRFGSFGGPTGCTRVPDPPTNYCFKPANGPKKCTPHVDWPAFWACIAYNGPKPGTFFYPIPTSRPSAGGSSNAASAASLFMQCILAATVCLEGGMPPTTGPSGPPGMSQAHRQFRPQPSRGRR
jgi:RHS repeat-associated protein